VRAKLLQVNNKATVMISTLVGDGVHERIILPEFPYLTDENGGACRGPSDTHCNAWLDDQP
jgi:hypothetical protein